MDSRIYQIEIKTIMKIAFHMTTMLEHGGGLEKYLIETAKSFAELPNIKADVVTMDDNFTYKIADLLSFYYLKKIKRKSLHNEALTTIMQRLGKANYYKCKNLKELKKKLNQYDVIYSKNELLEAFILKFCLGYKNIPPVIFGCHTPVHYPVAASIHSKLHNFLYNGFVYQWLASGVKAFHVTNNFDKELLEKLFPKRKVFKIYNPFNLTQFDQNLKRHSYDFQWDKSKCNILWIARLTEQKGVASLVKIINYINKTPWKEKIIFNILGNGPLENKVISLKKKWDNINRFGYVEYQYLPSIYKENDLFISTSKWECFPYNILEAQTEGIPVIAFNIPGPQDIIENKITGFLVDNENDFVQKIISLLNGDKKISKERIVKNTINKFNPKKIYIELKKMFIHINNINIKD